MSVKPQPCLDLLLGIPSRPDVIHTRGGHYSRELNVWIADGLASHAGAHAAEHQHSSLLEAYARMALAAGRLHRAQIEDSKNGRIWPQSWIDAKDGQRLVSFCQAHPEAGSPYCQVREDGQVIPFSRAYADLLHEMRAGLEDALASGDGSSAKQAPYLRALRAAFIGEEARNSDLELMGQADVAWVQTPADIDLLLLCEWTESYSDPLKLHVASQAEVMKWSKDVAQRNGMGPWRFFFEFRLLSEGSDILSQEQVRDIRATNGRLYGSLVKDVPSSNAVTEFRHLLMVAGHGANPPKNAKNYPNQSWIRDDHGYRNIIYANQMHASLKNEVLPALRAAFKTEWAESAALEQKSPSLRALFIVGHEENHPWLCFPEVSWMEEFKSDMLGLWSIAHTPGIGEHLEGILKVDLGSMLLLHRHHTHLMAKGDAQFRDYHVGNTIFLNQLLRQGYFVLDGQGRVMDVNPAMGLPAIEAMVQRVMAIKKGQDSIQALEADLFDGAIYGRFAGWAEEQAYFERIWES